MKKVLVRFTIISSIASTTQITINKMRTSNNDIKHNYIILMYNNCNNYITFF